MTPELLDVRILKMKKEVDRLERTHQYLVEQAIVTKIELEKVNDKLIELQGKQNERT